MKNLIVILGLLISTNIFSQTYDSTLVRVLNELAVKNPYVNYSQGSIDFTKVDTLITNNFDTRDLLGKFEQTHYTNEKYRILFFHNENLLVIESLENHTIKYMFLKFDIEVGADGLSHVRYIDEKGDFVILGYSNKENDQRVLGAVEISDVDGFLTNLYYK
jgi:hypothetical protein